MKEPIIFAIIGLLILLFTANHLTSAQNNPYSTKGEIIYSDNSKIIVSHKTTYYIKEKGLKKGDKVTLIFNQPAQAPLRIKKDRKN